jgi:hypothetical protein
MKLDDCVTLKQALRELRTYDLLFKNLARIHGVEILSQGRRRYVRRKDIERIRPHLAQWKNRPRLSQPASA